MNNRAYINGKIITMDSAYPNPDAVLVRDGRIAVVGSVERVLDAAGTDTVWYDLEGKALLPGFNDNHFHAVSAGSRTGSLDLSGLGQAEIIESLKERRSKNPADQYLLGYGWDYPSCPDPHRNLLDAHFPDIPVFLIQFSGHAMWINTEGLRRMGLLKPGRDPDRNVLADATGSPTGVVREAARNRYIRNQFRKRTLNPVAIRNSFRTILPALARAGITTVQDNSWFWRPVGILRELKRGGELTCRFSCWSREQIPFTETRMRAARLDEEWLHLGPRKFFFDGAFSSHSAWMFEDYADDPGNQGAGQNADEIYEALAPAIRRKRQPACHAIGDRAVHELCVALERLAEKYRWIRDIRPRIEHAQLIDQADIRRIADLGILVCAQPPALVNPGKDGRLLGPSRAAAAYPYRSLLDAGAALSFGSDYPGESFFEPLRSIHLAVNREGPERITVEEALACYTRESAYAEFEEESKGSISPGKLADFVILSDDPLSVPREEIEKLQVTHTIVGGELVYQAHALAEIRPQKSRTAPES